MSPSRQVLRKGESTYLDQIEGDLRLEQKGPWSPLKAFAFSSKCDRNSNGSTEVGHEV